MKIVSVVTTGYGLLGRTSTQYNITGNNDGKQYESEQNVEHSCQSLIANLTIKTTQQRFYGKQSQRAKLKT